MWPSPEYPADWPRNRRAVFDPPGKVDVTLVRTGVLLLGGLMQNHPDTPRVLLKTFQYGSVTLLQRSQLLNPGGVGRGDIAVFRDTFNNHGAFLLEIPRHQDLTLGVITSESKRPGAHHAAELICGGV
ncbi:uncharacterized protein PG998_004779 [Apiospora kogelbergensis]|uniref:uncharacterized protein n=1 Tax=Apiospora kogelbergensis TaxID=1337665 RepID=UPI00312E0895